MGYSVIKKSFIIFLIQTISLFALISLYVFLNSSLILLLIPIINFFIAYFISNKIDNYKKIIFCSLLMALLLFLPFAIYVILKNSFLGISLITAIFLFGFIISDLLSFLLIAIERYLNKQSGR